MISWTAFTFAVLFTIMAMYRLSYARPFHLYTSVKTSHDLQHLISVLYFIRAKLQYAKFYLWHRRRRFKSLSSVTNQRGSLLGSGCGSVGRAVASDTRCPRFESSHRQKFINVKHLYTVNCVLKRPKIKRKRGRELPI